ncbi:MAG: hypothetical protein MRY63_14325 [Neomegalonema sp.]|nr:hypothetical protein [Neomegalonema sp.]
MLGNELPEECTRITIRPPSKSERVLDLEITTGEIRHSASYLPAESRDQANILLSEEARAALLRQATHDRTAIFTELTLENPASKAELTFDNVTLPLRRGQLAASIVLTRKDKALPIALANIDLDRKEEFVGREREILTLFSGYRIDYRTKRAALWLLAGAALKAAALYFVLSLALVFGARILQNDPELSALLKRYLVQDAPLYVAGVMFALWSAKAFFVWQGRARYQSQMLRQIWNTVGRALDYLHKNADDYRPAPREQDAVASPQLPQPANDSRASREAERATMPDPSVEEGADEPSSNIIALNDQVRQKLAG